MHPDELRREFLRHVCQTSPSPLGIVVSRAEGATIWDADGRAYLDLLSGIGVANLGHGHPEVIAAVRAQAERYLHVMVYGEAVEEAQVRLAHRLAELTPGDLSVAFFCNSGTEAIEGAIKLARKATRRLRLVAFRGGYHGAVAVRQPRLPAALRAAPRRRRVPDLRRLQRADAHR
jgi:acetylornithine/N-succinyldiaminopimelate aminotransferase